MRLFIAEKPDVARGIAEVLGQTGKGQGYIECGQVKVTWCFGHMLEQAEPDEYTPDNVPRGTNGKKVWRTDELPIIPNTWLMRPKPDAEAQLAVIRKLIQEASEIVNAGDPDREGQLLVDEVLEHFGNKKPVLRYWASARDAVSVKRALGNLKTNDTYTGWGLAAKGRARADWLIGMNLTRAYTLRAQRGGSRALLAVGRVQTPTLALVVARDREIENFKPVPYFTLAANIAHQAGTFAAAWRPREDQAGLDPDGRLIDKAQADALVAKLTNKPATIEAYEQAAKKQGQPLGLSLTALTALAAKRWGYTADQILKACQALYEVHKLTSYPRTDCGYLPESQHADAPQVLAALKHVNPDLAELIGRADPRIKSRTWDDSKVTAHHAIIPTMHKGSAAALKEDERNVCGLVLRSYLAQFFPQHEYKATTVNVTVEGESFQAKGRVVTLNGWRDVYQDEDQDEKEGESAEGQALPVMKQGDPATCQAINCRAAKTKAPPRFDEGSLPQAMENIHRFVTDPEHKKILREGDGIGTVATRAAIITELKEKGYLENKGKALISTTLGRSLIDALPEIVKSPVLTALFERMLKGIEQGSAQLEAFQSKQEGFIRQEVAKANTGAVTIAGAKAAAPVSTLHKCMACGSGLSRRPAKKPKTFWWGCSNYPTCSQTYPDVGGKPDYAKGRSKQGDSSTSNDQE